MPPIYLIDASIYIFRAWFSIPDTMADKQGRPTNAVIGFFDFAAQLLPDLESKNVVFVFDESLESSHRNEIYPPYKQNRDPAPDELKRQFDQCRELIHSLGVPGLAHHRYEADDVIGTLVQQAREQGQSAVIVSADKDLAQLIRENDVWWHYAKRERLNYDGVTERFGVSPLQIADWLALAGDATDNIPGVPGIGAVTARKLLNHFDTLDALLENLDEVASIPGLRGASNIAGLIGEHTETLRIARQLTAICCDVPLPDDFTPEISAPDHERFAQLAAELGFSAHRHRQFEEVVRKMGW